MLHGAAAFRQRHGVFLRQPVRQFRQGSRRGRGGAAGNEEEQENDEEKKKKEKSNMAIKHADESEKTVRDVFDELTEGDIYEKDLIK